MKIKNWFVRVIAGIALLMLLFPITSFAANPSKRILVLLDMEKNGALDIRNGLEMHLAETPVYDALNDTTTDVKASLDSGWIIQYVNTKDPGAVFEATFNDPSSDTYDEDSPVTMVICRGSTACMAIGDKIEEGENDQSSDTPKLLVVSVTGSSTFLKQPPYNTFTMLMYPQNYSQSTAVYQTMLGDLPLRDKDITSDMADRFAIIYEKDLYSTDLYLSFLNYYTQQGEYRTEQIGDDARYLYNPQLVAALAIGSDYMDVARINETLTQLGLSDNDSVIYFGNALNDDGFDFVTLYNTYDITGPNWYAGDNVAEKDITGLNLRNDNPVKALAAAPSDSGKALADTAAASELITPSTFAFYYAYDTGMFIKSLIENIAKEGIDIIPDSGTETDTALKPSNYRKNVLFNSKLLILGSDATATGTKDFSLFGQGPAQFNVYPIITGPDWDAPSVDQIHVP